MATSAAAPMRPNSCSASSPTLHGSGVIVPLSKTEVHPLERLGNSNRSLLSVESGRNSTPLKLSAQAHHSRRGSGGGGGDTSLRHRRRFNRRRSNSDGDRYMLMADQRQTASERSLLSRSDAPTSTSSMPRRKSLDAQNVADLKVQLAEQRARSDSTHLLVAQLNAENDRLQTAHDEAVEKCTQLECDLTRQHHKYEDKISRLEAQLEAQAQELERIRSERDEIIEVNSRRGSLCSSTTTTGSVAATAPPVNRRNSLERMQGRRRSMQQHQQRRSSNDTVGSGGRWIHTNGRRNSVTSHGSHASGRWTSDRSLQGSLHNSTASMTSGHGSGAGASRRGGRGSITESIIGEVGASIRDLMAHARDAAGGSSANDLGFQDSLAPEDLLWMSDPSFSVDDLDDVSDDEEDDDIGR